MKWKATSRSACKPMQIHNTAIFFFSITRQSKHLKPFTRVLNRTVHKFCSFYFSCGLDTGGNETGYDSTSAASSLNKVVGSYVTKNLLTKSFIFEAETIQYRVRAVLTPVLWHKSNVNHHKIFKNNNRLMKFSGIFYLYLFFKIILFAQGGSPTPHPFSSRPHFVCKFSCQRSTEVF